MFVHKGQALKNLQRNISMRPGLLQNVTKYLEHHISDNILWEEFVSMIISLLHHLVKILLHVFKNKIQRVILTDNLSIIQNEF